MPMLDLVRCRRRWLVLCAALLLLPLVSLCHTFAWVYRIFIWARTVLNVPVWVKFIIKLYQSHFTRNTLRLAIRAIWSDQSSHHGLYRRRANEAAKCGQPMGAKEHRRQIHGERNGAQNVISTSNNNEETTLQHATTTAWRLWRYRRLASRTPRSCAWSAPSTAAAKLRRTKPRTNKMKREREREKNGATWKDRNSKINYTRMTW